MNDTPDRDVTVFTEALRLPSDERARYLDRACAEDAAMRRRVEDLLEAYDKAGERDFMEQLPTGVPQGQAEEAAVGENPGSRIGRYKLLQQIGEGGCGVVFMAEQEEPVRRRVALKVIKPGMDTKSVIARFEAERQALAMMDHPNIAHVFDAGATESGRPYFVMELVRGIRITEYCDQHNLTTAARLDLFIQVCQAVQHAHQKGIIHRDIKPSNVLVTTSDEGKPLPMVIDFGIAKATTGQQLTDKTVFTAFEMLIGTPAYMSPEQAALTSADVDTRSDIYSLGVLLYELLTGTTPFDSRELLKAGLDEVRRVIREQEPARPSTRLSTMLEADLTGVSQHRQAEPPKLIREVRGDLDWIVMTALEKDRGRRYQSANSLAEDIHRYLKNETVSARPPSRLYKLGKLISRNKLWFAAFGIVLATLIAGLSMTLWSLAKEKRAHREAELAREEADKQRKRAETDEEKAVAEAVRSRLVTQFLQEMVIGIQPDKALGRDTSILQDVIEEAMRRIATRLTNQPAVQAELRLTIGQAYGSLGQYDKAEPIVREALAFYRNSPAGTQKKLADALDILALIHQRGAKWAEAEEEGREALAIETKLHDKPSMRLVVKETHLAWTIVNRSGREAEAEAMFRKALATGVSVGGEDSEEMLDTRSGLGTALKAQGKLDEAETLFRENVSRRQELGPADHPNLAIYMDGLASIMERKGNLEEAEALNRQCLAIRRKMLRPDHPHLDETYAALMRVLYHKGKLAEAGDVCAELLALRRKRHGDRDRRVLDTISIFVEIIVDSRDEVRFEQLAKEFPWVWVSRSGYSAQRGRWQDAKAAATRFLEIDPGDRFAHQFVALLLVQTGDRTAYEEHCGKIAARFAGTADPLTASLMANACLILPRPGADLKVAIDLATRAVTAGQTNFSLHFFQCGMALAEYRQGHWDGAIDWAGKASENPSPYSRAQAYAILAMAQHQSKQTEASRSSLKKCVELVQAQIPKLKDGKLGSYWREWIIVHALLAEARSTIEGPATPIGKPDEK